MGNDETGASRRRAGTGASEQADRIAAKVRQLQDQLAATERQEQAWRAGSEGERLVGDALTRAGWPALHDLPWPGRQRANLDHLAFAPDHIWLIDAKHWSGEVVVEDGVLRQNRYSRAMAVEKARAAAVDVAAALGSQAPPVAPVLCLTNAGADLAPTTVDGVVLVGLQHLTHSLGPTPLLDVELALFMEKVPARLRGEVTSSSYQAGTSPRSRRAAPARSQAAQARPPRRGPIRKESNARPLLALVVLLLLLWGSANVDVLMDLIAPFAEWFVDRATTSRHG
jgi:hypothetical protein